MIFEKMCTFIVLYTLNILPFVYILLQSGNIREHKDETVRKVSDNITGMSVLCCLMLFIYYLFLFIDFLMKLS